METSVNNKCKAFTSLGQSRKLAAMLPLESADMWYQHTGISIKDGSEKPIYFPMVIRDCESDEDIPCWSLAALLEQLKAEIQLENKQILFLHINKYDDINYDIRYTNSWTGEVLIAEADNPVDACYKMILKLHERKIL